MAEKVEIIITAQDAASQVLRGVTSQFGELGNVIQSLTSGRILEELASQAVKFGKDSIDAFQKGAQGAKQLSIISGESIEETSRFIQVLDDFELRQEDALAATRALTKQGLEPNLETLAKLSDQYRRIKDPQEKNEFILKNLGRAGLQWAKVLDQGSEALLRHGKAINSNLIYTEEMYQKAERLRIAQDDLNDSWEAAKIEAGESLVPALTEVIDYTNALNRVNETQIQDWERLIPAVAGIHSLIAAYIEKEKVAGEVTTDTTEALGENSTALLDNADAMKEAEQAAKDLQQANAETLQGAMALTEAHRDYERQQESIRIKLQELQVEKEKLYPWESEKIAEIDGQIQELNVSYQENTKTFIEETNKRIAAMAVEKIAMQDGIAGYSEAELNRAQAILQTLDVSTRAAFEEQLATEKLTSAVADGSLEILEFGQIVKRVSADGVIGLNEVTAALNAIPSNKTITISTVTQNASGAMINGQQVNYRGRAGGGNVWAGEMFRVNETRTEYFKPAMNGSIVPLGNGGGSPSVNLTYAPMLSLGSEAEIRSRLLPIVIQGVKEAQAQGVIQ